MIKMKRTDDVFGSAAILPRRATEQSSGIDLYAAHTVTLAQGGWQLMHTGWQMAVEGEAHDIQIRPRSGLAARYGITVLNSPGTVDWDYRGEVCVILHNASALPFVVREGDRIAQMVIGDALRYEVEEVDSLDETERGSGGFGSTGR
jgi:dUTP pyrophosphatase